MGSTSLQEPVSLHLSPLCFRSLLVVAALEASSIPYQRRIAPYGILVRGEGIVYGEPPILCVTGRIIEDHRLILRYLSEQLATIPLLPSDPAQSERIHGALERLEETVLPDLSAPLLARAHREERVRPPLPEYLRRRLLRARGYRGDEDALGRCEAALRALSTLPDQDEFFTIDLARRWVAKIVKTIGEEPPVSRLLANYPSVLRRVEGDVIGRVTMQGGQRG